MPSITPALATDWISMFGEGADQRLILGIDGCLGVPDAVPLFGDGPVVDDQTVEPGPDGVGREEEPAPPVKDGIDDQPDMIVRVERPVAPQLLGDDAVRLTVVTTDPEINEPGVIEDANLGRPRRRRALDGLHLRQVVDDGSPAPGR
ncbi:MAG: hypothetical protein ACYSUA_07290, partial [Planctomycetota bacterium]